MAFGDVYICRRCKAVVSEDDAMWVEPERCPRCGAELKQPQVEEGDNGR